MQPKKNICAYVAFYSFGECCLCMWNGSLALQEGANEIEQPRNCQISFVIALSLFLCGIHSFSSQRYHINVCVVFFQWISPFYGQTLVNAFHCSFAFKHHSSIVISYYWGHLTFAYLFKWLWNFVGIHFFFIWIVSVVINMWIVHTNSSFYFYIFCFFFSTHLYLWINWQIKTNI